MRKLILSIATLFAVTSSQAAVGDDLTSKYLKNADFSQGAVIDNGICTYDRDMEANGTVYFGQQAVEGWEAFSLSSNTYEAPGLNDASPNRAASAVFAFNDEMNEEDDNIFLGGKGFLAPFMNSQEQEAGTFLGLVAVWGGTAQYTQTATLPAGCYTMTFTTYNGSGTGEVSSNLFGFIADNGKAYTCAEKSWGEIGTWNEMTVTFILDEETSGVISVGYVGPAGSGAMPHLFIESVKIEVGDATPIIQAQIDELKEVLLPLLEAGDELGVDTKAGWAVYNNDNATLDEVKDAVANQKEINEKGMTDLTDFFINNAHFAEGSPLDAGVCTYDYDMPGNGTKYFGMQPIEKWTASSPSDNVQTMANSGSTPANPLNSRASGLFAVGSGDEVWLGSKGDTAPATKANGSTEGNVFGFISVWGGTAYYSQHVTLPAGNYTITIPTYNERGTGAIGKNMCGFIADSGEEYLAETKTFPVGKWTNETIKFSLDDETPGLITIGYVAANAGSASMPHLFIDEFELKYNGLLDVTPSVLALQGAIRTAEEYTGGDILCESAIVERLAEAVGAGQSLISAGGSDDEANVAAATEINNIIAEAKASADLYTKFGEFLEGELAETIDLYSEGELAAFSAELSESFDEYFDAWESGEYTSEQINEIMSGLNGKVVAAIKAALESAAADGKEHSLDISALFANIKYANSTVEGWKNETGTSAFLSRVQTAEVWNQNKFNVYQTLSEMPAGAYEVRVNGFYRSAANLDNYTEWESQDVIGHAYLYAGGNQVLMHNVAEYAADQDDNHTAETGVGSYVPNSNANANYIFYTDGEAVNTLTTALLETGDLTIGIKGMDLEDNAWVVWGGFTVVYKGAGEELVKEAVNGEIDVLIAEAQAMDENDIIVKVELSDKKLNDAITAGEAAKESSSIEDKTDAIAELKAAIEYASKSEGLLMKLMDVFTLYYDLLDKTEVEGDTKAISGLLDDEIGDPEEGAKSNEQIEQWIDELPLAWTRFVCSQDGMATASEKAPVNVTEAILNPGFEGVTSESAHVEFWSVAKDGGNEGYEAGIYEFFNNNSFDIHQTVNALTPGYYRVRVQSFYRAGSNAANVDSLTVSPDSINKAYLYANESAVALKNVLDLEDVEESGYVAGEAMGVDGEVTVAYKDSEAYYIPNNRNSLSTYFEAGCYWNEIDCKVAEDGKLVLGLKKDSRMENDWCPYDNFQLFYLGTSAPTAVQGVAADAELAGKAGIFDLQGRKVSKTQKGLYIMNGKVVIVK